MTKKNKLKDLMVDLWWIVLAILVVLTFITMLGCASSKPIEVPDRVDTEEVTTPLPCIYDIALLEALDLPGLPPYPGEDSDEAEIKRWLADLKTAIGKREAKLLARVEAYELKLEAHNAQGPKCSEIE